MFQLNIHAKPNPNSDDYGKYKGAYVVFFIDYKDIDGAYELAKFYIQNNDWEVLEVEEEYFILDDKEQMDDNYKKYFDEVLKSGYTSIYNTYLEEE